MTWSRVCRALFSSTPTRPNAASPAARQCARQRRAARLQDRCFERGAGPHFRFSIDRIEVIRGGAPGIDMQGQTIVANVILKQADETQVIATLWDTTYGDGHLGPGGSLESIAISATTAMISCSRGSTMNDDFAGNGFRFTNVPGQCGDHGSHRRGAERVGYSVNGVLVAAGLRGRLRRQPHLATDEVQQRRILRAPNRRISRPAKDRSAELGANWDKISDAFEFKLVGLQRLERDHNFMEPPSPRRTRFSIPSAIPAKASCAPPSVMFPRRSDDRKRAGGRLQFPEGNSNFISTARPSRCPAPIQSNEKRGETFVQASWRLSPEWRWRPERVLNSPPSQPRVCLPAASFPQAASALKAWSPIARHAVARPRQRAVGRLDFNNFIASSNFSNNGVSAGNIMLVPISAGNSKAITNIISGKKARWSSAIRAKTSPIWSIIFPSAAGWMARATSTSPPTISMTWRCRCRSTGWGAEGTTIKPSLVWKDAAVADPVTGIRGRSQASRTKTGRRYPQGCAVLEFQSRSHHPDRFPAALFPHRPGHRFPDLSLYVECPGTTSPSRIWISRSSWKISCRISSTRSNIIMPVRATSRR